MKPLILFSLLLALPFAKTGHGASHSLGRLFFTSEERQQLEAQRDKPAETTPEKRSIVVNGIVKRHGAPSTVWLNGRPQDGDTLERTVDDTGVRLLLPGGRRAHVPVGASYDLPLEPPADKRTAR